MRLCLPRNAWWVAVLGMLAPLQAQDRKPRDHAYLENAARKIDGLVAEWYRQKNLPVPKVADDAKFLRRSFLVVAGRIPTMDEARSFLEVEDERKRALLADYLFQQPGYASSMSNWAFDLLRVADKASNGNRSPEPYRAWIRQSMEENMPWDKFCVSLLASVGDGWNKDTAAVGYYIRDRGMPMDNLANSMRIFLGSRMECAQCHDDPFGDTKRRDFFRLAAFTNGQDSISRAPMQSLWEEVAKDDRRNSFDYQLARVLWEEVYGVSLGGSGHGRIALPEDYQYHDGQPGEYVGARTPFGKAVRMSDRKDDEHGRSSFAEWVTSKTGPQFASVVANRMWKRVMGNAVTDPVDEYKPSNETHYPELANYLADLMVSLEYDLKAFQYVLVRTRTFQFDTNPNPSTVVGGDDFHGRRIQRMSAEQAWDSLVTLAAGDPDKLPRRSMDDRIYVNGKPVLVGRKTMSELSREVLALKNDRELRSYFVKLAEEVKAGSDSAGSSSSSMMMEQPTRYDAKALVRASELPSPAPKDHFLAVFGQSEREVVEGGSRDPNVGQVLAMMNGFVQEKLVNNSRSKLFTGLEDAKTPEEKIRRIYLGVLNRPPSPEEMAWMQEEVKASGDDAYRNIASALVLCSEFLFVP